MIKQQPETPYPLVINLYECRIAVLGDLNNTHKKSNNPDFAYTPLSIQIASYILALGSIPAAII